MSAKCVVSSFSINIFLLSTLYFLKIMSQFYEHVKHSVANGRLPKFNCLKLVKSENFRQIRTVETVRSLNSSRPPTIQLASSIDPTSNLPKILGALFPFSTQEDPPDLSLSGPHIPLAVFHYTPVPSRFHSMQQDGKLCSISPLHSANPGGS